VSDSLSHFGVGLPCFCRTASDKTVPGPHNAYLDISVAVVSGEICQTASGSTGTDNLWQVINANIGLARVYRTASDCTEGAHTLYDR
jgi:hypothetical protein